MSDDDSMKILANEVLNTITRKVEESVDEIYAERRRREAIRDLFVMYLAFPAACGLVITLLVFAARACHWVWTTSF